MHLNVTIELRDLFRAYFDAMKARIVIAAVICVAVMGGLTYLFLLIDEPEMLLKTSPLFFGFPLIGVIGQLLRIHAAYRKYIAALSESERSAQYMFQDGMDGFDVASRSSFNHIACENVWRIVERKHYFQIYLNKFDSRIIPKRCFCGEAEVEPLREILRSHPGLKVKLLGK